MTSFFGIMVVGTVFVVAAVIAVAALLANWDGLHTLWGDERED